MSAKVPLVLFGAPPDTGNLGVSALFESVVVGLFRRIPELELTVFDHGYGEREGVVTVDNEERSYRQLGCRTSKRYYRFDTLRTMQWMSRFGGLGNPGVQAIKQAKAVLDISGGDSFTDLYGKGRFDAITIPKMIAVGVGTPLVLLPQTYGPFQDPGRQAVAAQLVQKAHCAWARDERSYGVLKDLLGEAFDPARYQVGVDVAFGLVPRDPGDHLAPSLRAAIECSERPVGFNVSGLIYNDPTIAREQYGFRADYPATVRGVLEGILEDERVTLFLVPHVRSSGMASDCDDSACTKVAETLSGHYPGRVELVSSRLEPGEIKWVIGQMDWFCGTRMHSTIAGLSSGVPTASIAYSDKTRGVFETCGRGEHVIDPRVEDTPSVVDGILRSWQQADTDRPVLERDLESVTARAAEQLDLIVADIVGDKTASDTRVRVKSS